MSDRTFEWWRMALLALAVAGLLVSRQIVQKAEGGKLPSYMAWTCGGATNCNKVLASEYAKIQLPHMGAPVSAAAVGMAYFLSLGLWLLLVGRLPGRLHHSWAIPSLVALGGLIGAAWMICVMGRVLHAWCGLCLLTHAIDLPLILGVWMLWRVGGTASQPIAERAMAPVAVPGSWKYPAVVLVACLAAAVAQVRWSQASEASGAARAAQGEFDRISNDEPYRRYLYEKVAKVAIPVDADDPVSGPADARHTLVIFGDFACPHCAEVAELLPLIQKELGQKPMRIVFKTFPLSPRCNPARQASREPDAFEQGCPAAFAAEAARQLGGNDVFWKAHERLYQAHDQLPGLDYDALGRDLGLDIAAFHRLRDDPKLADRFSRVAGEAARLGIKSLPALFLDGRRVDEPWIHKYSADRQRRVLDMPRTVQYWKTRLLVWAEQAAVPTGPWYPPLLPPAVLPPQR